MKHTFSEDFFFKSSDVLCKIMTKNWRIGIRLLFSRLMDDFYVLRKENITFLCLPFSSLSEANPEKFNNRFRNKMFYAGVCIIMEKICKDYGLFNELNENNTAPFVGRMKLSVWKQDIFVSNIDILWFFTKGK